MADELIAFLRKEADYLMRESRPKGAKQLLEAADFIEQHTRIEPEAADRGWQPIETAPKGGVWIIGLTAHEVVPLKWGVSWNDQHWANGCVIYQPTHWQPLPNPPAIQSPRSEREGGQ